MNNPQQSYTLPDGEGRGGAIVFATNNKHKLSEIRAILGDRFHVLSLEDINCHADIPETANTLEGNAIQKARYVVDNYGYDCFADDTGLEVPELGGEPGVHSARYAEAGRGRLPRPAFHRDRGSADAEQSGCDPEVRSNF